MSRMSTTVKYVAELAHVREVSLFGTADLGFWAKRLKPPGFAPAVTGGRARLMIVAAEAKFRGIRFRELSFSVLVSRDRDGETCDGAYLTCAFNSCRFFAFCERAFFSTPYHHGDLRVSASASASIQLIEGGKAAFRADMGAGPGARERVPSRGGQDGFDGPVFLPPRRNAKPGPGRFFFARIAGETRTYRFVASQDALTITPSGASPGGEALGALVESGFVATEWSVRPDATHAKSKTYTPGESGWPASCS